MSVNSYQQGLIDENAVIQILQQNGHTVTVSTKDENIMLDIDCYVDGQPVSIKTQHSGLKSGNFVFELMVLHEDDCLWQPSWYFNGTATYYIIWVGDILYKIDKANLKAWVAANDFEKYRTNTNDSQEGNREIGHAHLNSMLGIVKRETLLAAGVAERLPYDVTKRRHKPITL